METGIPIVSTKLQPPIVRDDILQRPRLLDALDLVGKRRATLLCAGAGYGKTTVLSVIAASYAPVVWYSLSPSDSDLSVFVSYLVHGVRAHEPEFGQQLLQALSRKGEASANSEIVAGELVNALSEVSVSDLFIILDDLHAVDRNREILKVVDYLLTHLPTNTHLVLASRRAPRFASLPRLRMIGQVNDINEVDLRFTTEEAHTLYSQVYNLRLSSETVDSVAEQTEGWIIGLQLAAQSLRANRLQSASGLLASLGPDKKRLFEYLAEEILNRQPANVRRFLCESSVLLTFSSEDCDGILQRTDSSAILEYLEQNNLFVIEVADGYLRYHTLFRDFLRQQIRKEPGRCAELQQRAGAYFENQGDYVQAIEHYLVATAYGDAARLVCQVGQAMLRLSRFDTLTRWMSQIPDPVFNEEPNLFLLQAEVFELQGRYGLSLEWLERAAAAFTSKKDSVGLCRVVRGRAYVAAWRLDRQGEIRVLCGESLENLGPENKRERADLLQCMIFGDLADGNPSVAFEHYQQALSLYEELGDIDGMVALLTTPAMHLHNFLGDFTQALASLRRAHTLALEQNNKRGLAECLGCMAVALRHLNRCGEAKECAEKAVALSREIGAVQLEARNLDYLGIANLGGRTPDLSLAIHCFEESARLAGSEGNDQLRIMALVWKVVALRRLQEHQQAAEIGDRVLPIAEKSWHRWFLPTVQVNVGAALIGQDDARAEALLHGALQGFTRFQDKWNLAISNFWLAVLYCSRKQDQALEHFRVSLEIAKANGYGFYFIEESDSSETLLAAAFRDGIEPEYCLRLLGDIRPEPVADLSPSGIREMPGDPSRKLGRAHDSNGAEDRSGPLVIGGGGVAQRGQLAAPTVTRGKKPELRIRCFGNFRVYVGNRLIQEEEWRRKNVKSLLKLLASAPDHVALREQVVELFWGELTPEAAQTALWRALYFLRCVLEPQRKGYHSSFVVSRQGLLMLPHEAIGTIDVDEFTLYHEAAQRAERSGDVEGALHQYEAAERLYTGEFLADDPYEEWTMPRREHFRNLHVLALEKVAKWRLDRCDYEAAAAHSQRLLAEDNCREDAHLVLMRCLARMGRRREALAQFETCRETLREELHLEPTYETQELYSRLATGEAV